MVHLHELIVRIYVSFDLLGITLQQIESQRKQKALILLLLSAILLLLSSLNMITLSLLHVLLLL